MKAVPVKDSTDSLAFEMSGEKYGIEKKVLPQRSSCFSLYHFRTNRVGLVRERHMTLWTPISTAAALALLIIIHFRDGLFSCVLFKC